MPISTGTNFAVIADAACDPPPALPRVPGGRIELAVQLLFALYVMPGVAPWFLRNRAARLGPEGLVGELLRLLCTDGSRVPAAIRNAHVELTRARLETIDESESRVVMATRIETGTRAAPDALVAELRTYVPLGAKSGSAKAAH